MEFRLVYQGALKANGGPRHKHDIRKALHPQLAELWQHPPLSDYLYYLSPKGTTGNFPELVTEVGAFSFASLVHSTLDLRAELEVLILKLGNPGGVVLTGGDLDNQLKTLLDALRQPHAGSELPPGATPEEQEQPHFYCLLEDDRLITRVDLSADRWLAPPNPSHVHVHLLVRTKPSPITKHNLFLG